MTTTRALIWIHVCLMCVAGCATAQTWTGLPNGGFEGDYTSQQFKRIAANRSWDIDHSMEGSHANLLPAPWQPLNDQVGSARLWGPAPPRPGSTGQHSLRIGNPTGAGQTGIAVYQYGDGRLRFEKGKTYRLTLWYRSDRPAVVQISDENATDLRVSPYPEKFEPLRDLGLDWVGGIFTAVLPPSLKWREYRASFVIPDTFDLAKPGSRTSFELQLVARRDGWIELDDASVEPDPNTTKPATPTFGDGFRGPTPPKVRPGVNLLPNASFEVGFRGGWRLADGVAFARDYTDRGAAFDGSSSVRIDLPCFEDRMYAPGGRLRSGLVSSMVILEPGRTYTLSAYVKTSCPVGAKGALNFYGCVVDDAGTPAAKAEFDIGPDWARHEVTFQAPPMPHNAYYVSVSVKSTAPGAVWIDAIQLELGDKASAFKPAEDVAFGLSTKRESNLFLTSEPFRQRLAVYNSGTKSRSVPVQLTIKDIRGRAIWQEKRVLKNLPPGRTEVTIAPKVRFTGAFRMEVTRTGKKELAEELVGAVLPPPRTDVPTLESSMGSHISWHKDPAILRVSRRYGLRWIRLHDTLPNTRWEYVEPAKDKWVWDDNRIKMARKMGFEILGTLHAYTYQDWGKNLWFRDPNAENTLYIPVEGFEDYCGRVVDHYKGLINYWSFFNEIGGATGPVADSMADLLVRAHRAAKKADPNCKLVGCDLFPEHEPGYQQMLIKDDTLKLLDVFTIHYFTRATLDQMEHFVGLARADGKQRPVWVAEENFLKPVRAFYTREKPYLVDSDVRHNADYATSIDPCQASIDDLKVYVMERAAGISKRFFYCGWPIRDRGAMTAAYSDFQYDDAIGPLQATQGVYASLLDGTRFVAKLDLPGSVKAFVFERRSEAVACIWGMPNTPATLRLNANNRTVRVLDFQGNTISRVVGARRTSSVTLSEEPVFVVAPKMSGDALKTILASATR